MTRKTLVCGCIVRHYDDGAADVESCEVHEEIQNHGGYQAYARLCLGRSVADIDAWCAEDVTTCVAQCFDDDWDEFEKCASAYIANGCGVNG
jgi:hypothetical protein